jgi:hypothetical protein
MSRYKTNLAIAALGILFASIPIAAQETQNKSEGSSTRWYNPTKYNPLKLIKRDAKSANNELASDGHLEDRLTKQLRLQGILPANKELQEVCSGFKELASCIAVLRLTHSLPVEFTCLKWNVTGVKPKSVADSCAGPAGGKAMPLDRAIDLLKPDVDSTKEARSALRKAHDDIRDARA